MEEPIYGRALRRASQLVLHHKILWVFGVLSLLLGQLGWNNFVGSLSVFSGESSTFSSYFLAFPWTEVWQGSNIFWSLWLMIVLLAVSLLVIVLSVVSEGALIAAATSWYKGVKNIKIDEAWHKGAKHFWRLFVVHFVKKFFLVSLLVFVNSLVATLSFSKSFSSTLMIVVVVAVSLFAALLISTTGVFAAGYVVESELPALKSIQKGFQLFKEHVLVSLELSLILLFIQAVIVLIFVATSTWILFPLFSLTIVGGLTESLAVIMVGFFISVALFFLAAALVGGVLNAFATSAWMYLFMKMHHEGVASRILSWFHNRG